MSYNKLLRLNTYHNENTCTVTIKGQDTRGNKMFKDIVLTYKLGEHVQITIPEYVGYYVTEDKLDFCIRKDTEFVLVYHKFFIDGIHIDLHDIDTKDQLYHIGRYTHHHECPLAITEELKKFIEEYEYTFEDMHYDLDIPTINGYFVPDQETQTYWVTNGKLHFIAISDHIDFPVYKRFRTLTVHYINEYGESLYDDEPELTSENMIDNHVIYTPVIKDDDYYYEPVFGSETVNIPLTDADNEYTITLIKYRKVYVHYNIWTNGEVEESDDVDIIDSREQDGEVLKLKVDDLIIIPITKEIEGYYTNTKSVEVKILNDEHIYVDFYKYLRFDLVCMYEHNEIQRETYNNKPWNVPFVVQPPVISGKKTDTAFVIFNGEEDKIIYVVYH